MMGKVKKYFKPFRSPVLDFPSHANMKFLLLAGLALVARGADPSSGWLSYARYDAPSPTDTITKLSASMIVPETPVGRLGSAAFWFGVQTFHGDGALVQPIMSKWLGDSFYMFQEIFDWTDENDEQTSPIKVAAGDLLTAEVAFVGPRRYIMNMTNHASGRTSNYHYDLLDKQTATESTAYFVLEHQPSSCRQLPPNGNVTWFNIAVEVNGQVVASPQWKAMEEEPKCGSKAVVTDPATVSIVFQS